MKHFLTCTLLCTSLCYADEYVNFLRQIQNDADKTTLEMSGLANEGTSDAEKEVITSSVFELWALNSTTAEEHLLDVKTVSAYHPQAEISITSDDPYTLIPRTRIDQPFTVTYTIDGLITDDPSVQDAAKSVMLARQLSSGEIVGESEIDKNETDNISLPALEGSSGSYEEFVIYAHPDGYFTESTELATQKVMIFPMATGKFTGFTSGEKFITPPTIKIKIKDMYPRSDYYIQVSHPDWSEPKVVENSVTKNPNEESWTPANKKISGLRYLMTEAGIYTVDLRVNTPFGDRSIYSNKMEIEKTLKLNGNFSSSN